MVDYSTLALVLTGLGLTASILYYAVVLRNANKTQQLALETRQAQLFMQMYNRCARAEALQTLEGWALPLQAPPSLGRLGKGVTR